MKLLGIVILYYPDEEVKQNILSYLTHLDKLILWENTPLPDRKDLLFDPLTEQKIIRRDQGKNVGMGVPLNSAVRYGWENGYTHLLTMDQDSCFETGMFRTFLQSICLLEEGNRASFSANTHPYEASQPESEEIDICITSGTIYKLSVFEEVGLFREDFFIDGIDTEFCFRLRKYGKKAIRVNTVYMHHVLGKVTVTPFLWGKLISPNYPARRTYYLVRNTLYLRYLYPGYPQAKGTFKAILFWRPLTILLVEPDKYRKFKAIFLGLFHAFRRKTGEYTVH